MIWPAKWLSKSTAEHSFRVDVIKDDELGVRMSFLFTLVLRAANDLAAAITYKSKINTQYKTNNIDRFYQELSLCLTLQKGNEVNRIWYCNIGYTMLCLI